jgi:hypothetical protein
MFCSVPHPLKDSRHPRLSAAPRPGGTRYRLPKCNSLWRQLPTRQRTGLLRRVFDYFSLVSLQSGEDHVARPRRGRLTFGLRGLKYCILFGFRQCCCHPAVSNVRGLHWPSTQDRFLLSHGETSAPMVTPVTYHVMKTLRRLSQSDACPGSPSVSKARLCAF